MNWSEITVEVPLEYTDTAAAIANMAVPYGIYIEDYSDLEQNAWDIAHIDLIDDELVTMDRTKAVIHLYISECDNPDEAIAFLKERMTAAGIAFEVNHEKVDDAVESTAEKTEGITAPFLCFEDMALLCQRHHDTYEDGDGESNYHKFVFISAVKGNLLHLL